MNIDNSEFIAEFTRRFFKPTAAQQQGLEFIVQGIAQDTRIANIHEAAYPLATVDHETGRRFEPIDEIRAHPIRQPRLWASQLRYWGSGYYGRGYVQLTWLKNYLRQGQKLQGKTYSIITPSGAQSLTIAPDTFVARPELVKVPEIALEILIGGMVDGDFTGRKLRDYRVTNGVYDYENMRRIINGMDKAKEIAAIARGYENCLKASV